MQLIPRFKRCQPADCSHPPLYTVAPASYQWASRVTILTPHCAGGAAGGRVDPLVLPDPESDAEGFREAVMARLEELLAVYLMRLQRTNSQLMILTLGA